MLRIASPLALDFEVFTYLTFLTNIMPEKTWSVMAEGCGSPSLRNAH
jgi:hypothetical protein